MRRLLLISLVATFSVCADPDVAAGKSKAALCNACHGANGISLNQQTPNLAGQKALYLSNQLIAYRSGIRKNNIMSPLAKPLSNEDIANLAAYFSSLPAGG